MDIFAKIRLSDSHYCGLFKLIKIELGGVETNVHAWKIYWSKTDKLKRDPSNAFHLKKSEAQQFHINGQMHFSFEESDLDL